MRNLVLIIGYVFFSISVSQAAINLEAGSGASSAYTLLNESRILISRGQYDTAINSLEELKKLYPNNSQVFYWLSTANDKKGNIEKALSYIKKGIQLAPQNSEFSFRYAKLLTRSKDYPAAEKELKRLEKNAKSAILRKKVKHELSMLKGFRLLQQGKSEQALSYFQNLVQIFPRDATIKETLGNIYFSLKFYDDAERTYLQALTLKPNSGSILFSLAGLFKQYGDLDYSHTYLKRAIELDPSSAIAQNAIKVALIDANSMIKTGNIDKALSYIKTVTNVIPYHKKANTQAAAILRTNKRHQEAAQVLKNVLSKYPTDTETRVLLSDILNESGNVNAAIEELHQLISLSPDQNYNLEINTKINILYGKKARELGNNLNSDRAIAEAIKLANDWYNNGRYDTSQWLVEAAIKKNPQLHDAHLILGRIYAKRSQFRQALQEFATAIKIDHNTIEARQEYALVLEMLGDYQSAEAVYVDIKPLVKSPILAKKIDEAISIVKAEKFRQKGQFNSALRIYEKLDKKNPNNIRNLQYMGNIYLSMGNTERAEKVFERLIEAERSLEKQLSLTKKGNELLNQRKYQEARKTFSKIIELNPNNAHAHYLLGSAYVKEGKLKDAVSAIEKSTRLDPSNLSLKLELARLLTISGKLDHASRLYETVYRNTKDVTKKKDIKRLSSFVKGQYLIKQRKFFDAVQHYETAAQIFTQDAQIHEALASLYYTQNLNEEALDSYMKALDLNPTNFKIHIQLADLYGRIDNPTMQMEHLESAFLNQTDAKISSIAENKILAIAKREINIKQYSSANMKLALVLSKNPQNITASYILADLYRINKKYDKAESVYYQILAFRPVDLDTRSLLATLYLETKKHDSAITEFEKIVSISPDSNLGKEARSKLNVLLLEKADILVSNAKTNTELKSILDTAVDWLDKDYYEASQWLLSNIIQRQPQNAEASYWLGELYLERGNFELGLKNIYNAAKLDVNNMDYRFRFGQALSQNGQYDQSAQHLKSVIKKAKDPEILQKAKQEMARTSGRLLIQKKDYKKAISHFRDAERLYKVNYDNEIAEAMILRKQYSDAEKLLLKRIAKDSSNFIAHGLLARIYKEKGDIRNHLIQLDKAWLGSPGEGLKQSAIINLGLSEGFSKLSSKTWGDAIIEFNRALSHDPNNLYAVLGKHVALFNSGNIKQAEEVLKGLLKEKEKTMQAKLKFLEVRSLVSH